MASARSRARLEASSCSPGMSADMSCARNSCRPAVTTLARCDFLLRSATRMASSILPSRRAPATAGANARDCLRAALNAIQRSIITPIDQPDMTKRMMTTMRASQPICFHKEIGSHPGAPASWKIQRAKAETCAMATVARFARTIMGCCFPPQNLLLLTSDTVELGDGRFLLSGCLPAGLRCRRLSMGGAVSHRPVTLLGFHPEFLGGLLLDSPATILADSRESRPRHPKSERDAACRVSQSLASGQSEVH